MDEAAASALRQGAVLRDSLPHVASAEGLEGDIVARATRILLERTSGAVGADFFMAMARGVAETLGTRYGFVGQLADPSGRRVRTLAVWDGDAYIDNFEYDLAGTPCEGVLAGELCHYPSGVAGQFPDDIMLVDMGIESYLGLPIIGRNTKALGLVVALHNQATAAAPELAHVLELFAQRASAELERIRFEADLARSEARYRQIISSCIEGVWLIDAAAVTTFVNAQMAAMLGYSETEMVGRPLFDFMDAAGRALAELHLARRAEGVAEQHEFRFLHKRGDDVWLLMAANPLYDHAGAYAGALALATDITEKRRLDAVARQTQRLESLGVLAGGVAHDFNNLLVGILGNAEIALQDGPTKREALEDIRTAALRAAELTGQLLAFAGKGTFVMAPVDINATIPEMARLLSAAVSKKTELRFVPTSVSAWVEGDASQLNQVLMNLILNASEALDQKAGTVTITTGTLHADSDYLQRLFGEFSLEPGEYVWIEVADTGCGMDAATQAKIFDPFFSTKFTGRGLGLAALLGVLRAHRGAVRVESAVGKGTTFKVLLPSTTRGPLPAVAEVKPAKAAPTGRQVVLIADDEALIRSVVQRALAEHGYRVIPAIDGPDALAQFRARGDEVDLVLLDLTMPGLSGEEVFHELRRLRADVKVLVTSGYAADDAASRLGASPTGFLPKPWTMEALLAAVRDALEG